MTKLVPEWIRTSDPVIRSPACYRWTTAPAIVGQEKQRRLVSKRSGRFISMEGCFYPCHADHILMHHKYIACIHIRIYLHTCMYVYICRQI